MASTTVAFDIIARDRASDKFNNVGSAAGSAGKKTSKFGAFAKKAGKAAGVGLLAAGAGAVVLGKKLISAGEAAGTSNARIEQINKSMGLFGKEADDVSRRIIKMSDAQARATGIDQNAIKETNAKLLTFKELAKSADDVGGAFDRTSQIALDMEAAGFGDARQAAVMLGKALNDPITGMSSLRRVGVAFTEDQEDQIKGLAEAGKMGKAHNLMLREMEKQVGGTAEATANGTDKLKVMFSQLTEQVGLKLVPVVDKLAVWFADKAMPALQEFGKWAQANLPPLFDKIRSAVKKFTSGSGGDISSFINDVKIVFEEGVAIVTDLWAMFGDDIKSFVKNDLKSTIQILKGAFKIIKGVFKVVSGILKGDWGKVWSGIKDIVKGSSKILTGLVKKLFNLIKTAFNGGRKMMGRIMSAAWDGVKTLARSGVSWLGDKIGEIPGKLRDLGGKMRDAGKFLIGKMFDGLKAFGRLGANVGKGLLNGVIGAINAGIRAINTAIWDKIPLPGLPDIDLPNNPFPTIPRLFKGGIVKGSREGTLVVAGDKGNDEAVVPLTGPHARRMAPGAGGGDTYVTVNINRLVGDPIAEGRELERILTKYVRDGKGGARLEFAS